MDNLYIYISTLCNYRLNELHGQILMANPLAFQVPNRAGRQAAQLSVGVAAVGDSAEIERLHEGGSLIAAEQQQQQ